MSTPQGEAGMSSPVCSVVLSVCDASSDVCLGDDMWRTGCCPCSTFHLSTSLIDQKEQQCCYSLAPVPSQELQERGCGQQRTDLGLQLRIFPQGLLLSSIYLNTLSTSNWHSNRSMGIRLHRHLGICVYVPQMTY